MIHVPLHNDRYANINRNHVNIYMYSVTQIEQKNNSIKEKHTNIGAYIRNVHDMSQIEKKPKEKKEKKVQKILPSSYTSGIEKEINDTKNKMRFDTSRQADRQNISDEYVSGIATKISSNLEIPTYISNGSELVCIVHVVLDIYGNIQDISIRKSSGNSAMDRIAKNSILKSAPFYVPNDRDAFLIIHDINFTIRSNGKTYARTS